MTPHEALGFRFEGLLSLQSGIYSNEYGVWDHKDGWASFYHKFEQSVAVTLGLWLMRHRFYSRLRRLYDKVMEFAPGELSQPTDWPYCHWPIKVWGEYKSPVQYGYLPAGRQRVDLSCIHQIMEIYAGDRSPESSIFVAIEKRDFEVVGQVTVQTEGKVSLWKPGLPGAFNPEELWTKSPPAHVIYNGPLVFGEKREDVELFASLSHVMVPGGVELVYQIMNRLVAQENCGLLTHSKKPQFIRRKKRIRK